MSNVTKQGIGNVVQRILNACRDFPKSLVKNDVSQLSSYTFTTPLFRNSMKLLCHAETLLMNH